MTEQFDEGEVQPGAHRLGDVRTAAEKLLTDPAQRLPQRPRRPRGDAVAELRGVRKTKADERGIPVRFGQIPRLKVQVGQRHPPARHPGDAVHLVGGEHEDVPLPHGVHGPLRPVYALAAVHGGDLKTQVRVSGEVALAGGDVHLPHFEQRFAVGEEYFPDRMRDAFHRAPIHHRNIFSKKRNICNEKSPFLSYHIL